MITFTLIFFLIIVVVGIVVVTGFAIYMKRKTKKLRAENRERIDEPPTARSLFESSDEELKSKEDKL